MDGILEKYRNQWIQLVEPVSFQYFEENIGNKFSQSTEGDLVERIDFKLKNICK